MFRVHLHQARLFRRRDAFVARRWRARFNDSPSLRKDSPVMHLHGGPIKVLAEAGAAAATTVAAGFSPPPPLHRAARGGSRIVQLAWDREAWRAGARALFSSRGTVRRDYT